MNGCTKLKSVIMLEGVTEIGGGDDSWMGTPFQGCSELSNVIIPNSLTSIGYKAFKGCTKIENIIIPNSVITIESSVFSGWTADQTIYCEAETQPSGWNSSWKSDEVKVEWGYKPTPET